jgi:hypothetical protein
MKWHKDLHWKMCSNGICNVLAVLMHEEQS